ncbi:MAG: hypothetical protein AAF710_10135 [Planctomycetota bacterium]
MTACGFAGCEALTAVNPSFDLSYAGAREQLRRYAAEPVPLERPLVFVGPFLDPFFAEWSAVRAARRYTGAADRVTGVSFAAWDTFDRCRAKVIAAVDEAFPTDDPDATVEVDVIGFSMGGLVTRYAAMPPDAARGQTRRLRVRRVFTIASPHRGAAMGPLGAGNALARDMTAGSEFLARLDAAWPGRGYELFPYVRLSDAVVGQENTAPPGMTPWWTSSRPFEMAHVQAATDPRIRADIFARLRGEEPFTQTPAAPLPD